MSSTAAIHDELESKIKDITHDLYMIMAVTANYDTSGRPSKDLLLQNFNHLSSDLQDLVNTTANPAHKLPEIPPELINYVDDGRNPDIYKREFVELVRRGNQLMKGRMQAFTTFQHVLAAQMSTAMPELQGEIDKVLAMTRGSTDGGTNDSTLTHREDNTTTTNSPMANGVHSEATNSASHLPNGTAETAHATALPNGDLPS